MTHSSLAAAHRTGWGGLAWGSEAHAHSSLERLALFAVPSRAGTALVRAATEVLEWRHEDRIDSLRSQG